MQFPRHALAACTILFCASLMTGCASDSKDAAPPTIKLLSSDPAFVTGGDALISVAAVDAASARKTTVTVNGTDVTAKLALDSNSFSLKGLIEGLKDGSNEITARVGDGGAASLYVRNYPQGGPVFSGPQLQPWVCKTIEAGLGAATDAQCNAPARFQFFYMSVASGTFKTYDPNTPPAAGDIANTTTDHGVTVPYVVRLETGTVDRAIYQIAVLFDRSKSWSALAPQASWNHKMYVPTAGGFSKIYDQGTLPQVTAVPNQQDLVLNDMALKRGFLVAKTSFWVPATNHEPVRAAESLLMLKERITEQYGSIRYTLTSGASGGSMTMTLTANNYPGLLQGIIPTAEFTDFWSTTEQEIHDCFILKNYFAENPAVWPDASQRISVYGHINEISCNAFLLGFLPLMLPGQGTPTGTPPAAGAVTYNPVNNPGGARGTLQDYQVNYLGRREQASWSAAEKAAGRGFARDLRDNVGVQYGLQALLGGRISTEQFVGMNEQVGGVDIDFNRVAQRSVQDSSVAAIAYRAGLISDMRNMDKVAIISPRLPDVDPIAAHSMVHSYIYLDRLRKAQGHTRNHVLWRIPGFNAALQHELSFVNMDRWLAAIEADNSADALATKVVRSKPADLVDGCWAPGTAAADVKLSNQVKDTAQCEAWYPVSATPRIASSANGSRDVTFVSKCQLKPLARTDYGAIAFTDVQWARLQTSFPDGVCDYTKPDAAQTPSVPWLDYSRGPGGQAMTAPVAPPSF